MSIPLVVNGVTFNYPVQFDVNWGPTLTAWSSAVTSGMLQTSGVNKPTFIASATVNPASSGFLRLAKTDAIVWRNNLNNANLLLAIDGSNQLTFNGTPIGASASLTDGHIFVGNISNQPADVVMSGDITIDDTGVTTIGAGKVLNSNIVASAGITLTKLAALTASIVPITNASGFLSSSAVTPTELGYISGVTSSIQTQINALTASQGNYLPLAGGTMSGAIAMASHKVTGITSGSTFGDALAYGQSGALLSGLAVGSQKITGLANGTASTDAVALGQLIAPTFQAFSSGSGTYTTPTSPRTPTYLRVLIIGGGGGGSGSAATGGTPGGTGGTGGTSTFGTSLLTATGGVGGTWGFPSGAGGAGGTPTATLPATGFGFFGSSGSGNSVNNANGDLAGAAGAGSPFAGPTMSGANNQAGAAGGANTGTGGQGGGTAAINTTSSGVGGGAGGYVEGTIPNPGVSYSYAVGAGGTGGSAGSSGSAGGAGGSGYIIIEEHYQ